MKPYGPFPLVAGVQQEIDLDLAPVVGTLVLKNLSPFTLTVQAFQSLAKVIPLAIDALPIRDFQGKLLVTPAADLNFQNAPGQLLYIDAYGAHEAVPGNYPVSLGWLTNIGNAVPVMSSADAIQNNGNAPGTPIITAQDNASASVNELLNNDGTETRNILSQGGVLSDVIVIQRWDGVHPARIFFGGFGSGPGGEVHLRGKHNGSLIDLIQLVPNFAGGPAQLVLGGDPAVQVKPSWMKAFSGTGSGTFNHGLGITPTLVLVTLIGSVAGGYATTNYTPTTVDITVPSSSTNWRAVALYLP